MKLLGDPDIVIDVGAHVDDIIRIDESAGCRDMLNLLVAMIIEGDSTTIGRYEGNLPFRKRYYLVFVTLREGKQMGIENLEHHRLM